MQTKQTHWASLLALIAVGTGTLFLLLIAAALGIASLIDLFDGIGDAVSEMIGAVAFGFLAILLLVCLWFILQKARGVEQADLPFKFPFSPWMWAVVPAVAVFSIVIGGLITLAELPWVSWIFLPLLTILVIVPPIWLLYGTASNGLDLGPRWRFFTVFGVSMTVAPFLMIVLEMVVLTFIIVAGAVYATITRPTLVQELESVTRLMNQGGSEEALISLMAPYLTNPTVIAVVIGYIALIVPLIEELFKPLAVWLFAQKIESPAQGFALGVLSGAAFTLVESLNAGADGTTSWAIIVTARTGTSALHLLTSGLVGWGIASAFKEKRVGRFFGAYISAVLIHGIWNASAAGTGLSALGESLGKPEWVFNFAPALICGLLVMAIGVVALLFMSNRKLRKQIEAATAIDLPKDLPSETTEKIQ